MANGKEVGHVSAAAKNLFSIMSEFTGGERSKVLVQTKEQWKIVLPAKYHNELIDPYYGPDGGSIKIESSSSNESDEDSMKALDICDSFDIIVEKLQIVSPNEEIQVQSSPTDVQPSSTPKNCRIPSTPTKFLKLMPSTESPASILDEPQTSSTSSTVQIVRDSVVVKSLDEEIEDVKMIAGDSVVVKSLNEEIKDIKMIARDSVVVKSLDEEIKDIKMKHIVSRPITGNLSLLVKYPCLFCPMITSDFGDMLQHLRKHDRRNCPPGKKMFCCSMCTFMSDVEVDIWYHSRLHFDTQI